MANNRMEPTSRGRISFIGATTAIALATSWLIGIQSGDVLESMLVAAAAVGAVAIPAAISSAVLIRPRRLMPIRAWMAAGVFIPAMAAIPFWLLLDTWSSVVTGDWGPGLQGWRDPAIIAATIAITVPVGLVSALLVRYFMKTRCFTC